MKEKWKPVKNLFGLYWVSNLGQVKRRLKNGEFNYTFGHKDGQGYFRIVLQKNGKKIKDISVHKLVVETFIRKLKRNEVCHHKNHIRTDNRL